MSLDFPPDGPSTGSRFWDELRFFDGHIAADGTVSADGAWETAAIPEARS